MKTKILVILFSIGTLNSFVNVYAELPKEEDIVICQDSAELFGSGKGKDLISINCVNIFKSMAQSNMSAQVSTLSKTKYFGYRNMIIIERLTNAKAETNIIAGNSTELKNIKSLAFDEKNQEVAVLEDSGDILFFSSKITGNVAPYRIIKHRDLLGASEIVIDNVHDQVIVNNDKIKKILFFSRLANIYGQIGKQKLNVLNVIDTTSMDLKGLVLDLDSGKLHGYDSLKNQETYFLLK